MLGSSASIADANTVLNTIAAEMIDRFSDRLEKAEDFNATVRDIVVETYRAHKRIIFNGNGYAGEWYEEAARRGLHNYATAAEAIPHLLDPENVALFERHGIFTEPELASRCEIMLDTNVKVIAIEANTMMDIAEKDVLPAVSAYVGQLCAVIGEKEKCHLPHGYESGVAARLAELCEVAVAQVAAIAEARKAADAAETLAARALAYSKDVRAAMSDLRATVDEMETRMPRDAWPYPSYADILFY